MKDVEEVRLTLPHIELAGHFYGPSDGRPVLALHGWLDNANSFSRLAPRLPGLRILALDMAGHGFSDHRPPGASYSVWDYAQDALHVAQYLGWERFSLMGHSLGAIVSVILAGAVPERVERLALIDGLIPPTTPPEKAPEQLGAALRAQLAFATKRKPVYETFERAAKARAMGRLSVSLEAAESLAQRGLMPVAGGYTWRSDARLTQPSAVRLTEEQALAFIGQVRCPAMLVVAEEGVLIERKLSLSRLPFEQVTLPGGHHLHLDDEAGAALVADCFKRFFAVS